MNTTWIPILIALVFFATLIWMITWAIVRIRQQRRAQALLRASPGTSIQAQISDPILPMERDDKYGTPLDGALQISGMGRVVGGGTQMTEDGRVAFVTIDIELRNSEDALAFACTRLRELGAPKGSQITYHGDKGPVTIEI